MTRSTIGRAAGKALIGMLAVLAVIAGCTAGHEAAASIDGSPFYMASNPTYLFIDPDTGCHYLKSYNAALTPRIAADGRSHMGCKGGAQ